MDSCCIDNILCADLWTAHCPLLYLLDKTCKRKSMAECAGTRRPPLEYLLIMDFEATCDRDVRTKNPEIIEFPCVIVQVDGCQVGPEFHEYVRPTETPTLTPFCTELTGIVQEQVDAADTIDIVLPRFCSWVAADQRLKRNGSNYAIVTCGDWDIKTCLSREASRKGLALEPMMTRWINIKETFLEVTGRKGFGMSSMLQDLGLHLDGRHHSGIDDARNIAKIAVSLLERGAVFRVTGELKHKY